MLQLKYSVNWMCFLNVEVGFSSNLPGWFCSLLSELLCNRCSAVSCFVNVPDLNKKMEPLPYDVFGVGGPFSRFCLDFI